MNNSPIIEKFYTSFQNKDWDGMQKCYHEDVEFSDPVFPQLKGKKAKAMWHMLLSASTDLSVSYSQINSSDNRGSCHWEAIYVFSRTGRKVHNKIDAQFEFKNGLIIHHQDSFNLWKWSQMALGLSGIILGWSPFMSGKIQAMAGHNLINFIEKNPQYL